MALREERTYNVLGQRLTQAVRKGNSVDVKWRITNEYGLSGNNGNLTKQWTETGIATYGVRYVYDGANRIRGAAENAPGEANLASQTCAAVGGTWCVKYAINGFGNAWTENKSPTAGGLTPLAETSFEAFTNRLLGASYYANGFQKSLVLNDTQSRAEYDSDGRLRKAGRVTTANGVVWDASQLLTENTYNGAGQRVKRTVTQGPATSTIHYVYGLDGEVASEWESSSTVVTGRQFLVGDQLGSTRVRFDANGEVLQRIDYEPYGGEVQRTGVSGYSGANEVRQKFTGKERDAETGLDFFEARYLSSAQGRFTSPDPLLNSGRPWDARSWNRYSYTLNSPLIFVDPNGLYEYGTCNGSDDQCKQARAAFEAALQDAAKASKALKDSNARNAVNESLRAIGKAGDKNGVVRNFDFKNGAADTEQTGNSTVISSDNGRLTRVQEVAININPNYIRDLSGKQTLSFGATFAQLVAHEGVHIPQARIDNTPPKNFDEYFRREFPAFLVGSYVNEGLNRNAPFGLWNTSWANAADKDRIRNEAITKQLQVFGGSLDGAQSRRPQ